MWKAIGKVLFWTYRRGSLQYDLMCAVILAFIFLTPVEVFDGTLLRKITARDEKAEPPPHHLPKPGSESQPQTAVAQEPGTAGIPLGGSDAGR